MTRRVFVFGSNLAGIHGRGSALHAQEHWGAERGVGIGPTGNAYAIPTKDGRLQTLSLERIAIYVDRFLRYARAHPEIDFILVAVGCGLAGYSPEQIAPLFYDAPRNVKFPQEFERVCYDRP